NTFSGSLTRDSGENIGVYAIQQGTLALSANYNLSYASANLTINTRPLTITVNSKNKLYGAPLPVLDGIETGIVASDNITVSYSTTATQASPIGIYPITATLNDPNSRLFNYTVTNTASNLTIAVVPVTTAVSTNVATQQYSDVVTFTATINNGAPVVTGANGAAVSVTFKVGNQIMGTVPFTVSGNNLTGILANKQLVEGIPGQMSPGDKTVTAIFNMPNANYGLNSNNNSGTCSLTVTKENADITYTGQDYMSLPVTSATSMTISLSATIRDLFPASDGHRGNIKNARVTFRRDSPAGVCLGAPQLVPALMTDSTTGTVVTTFTYNLTTTELQSGGANLQVYAVVENYYTGGTSDVAACITIARPGGEFVTGGGYLKNNSCAGVIAGTKDLKTNFGFNMQYTKSGSNLKGQCNIIIRSNGKIYQIKSNAVNTLVVSAATSKGTPAYFNTKANYRDITDPLNPVSLGGNMDLTVKMNDVTTGGQLDSASILIMDPNTSQVVFSSNWSGVQTKLQNLGGGNVSVRSTPSNTVTMAREAQAEEIILPAIQNPFAVKVLGNPALDHFNVNIKGSAGKISLRVVDIQGRVVEYRQNVPEGTLQLGHTYQKGFYYLEVRQGNSIRQIKLVKL
ncbi:MBG domain-containing protein, partial [Niastella populi]|uniref:MBG domain-containing protein n=1 Tax=Niastella populi TaxID=550983 RepID=UPI001055E270